MQDIELGPGETWILSSPTYYSFEEFKNSFKVENELCSWYSKDQKVIFKKFGQSWLWFVSNSSSHEKSLIESMGLQTNGFRRLKDAVEYVKAVFPWFDLSKISIEKRSYFNLDNVSLVQEPDGWAALGSTAWVKDQNGVVIVGKTRFKLLRIIWDKRAIDGKLVL